MRARVEIGPRDAQVGVCVLALCLGQPGEVAQKRTMPEGRLVEGVLQGLGLGLPPQTLGAPPAAQPELEPQAQEPQAEAEAEAEACVCVCVCV